MANLLSPRELKRVRAYFRSRFVGTGSLVAIVCGVAALLALIPVYAMVRGAETSPEETALQIGLSEEADREEINRARLLLRELEPFSATSTSVLKILSEIFEARPPLTSITSISLERGEAGIMILSGASGSREEITSYRDALANNARFSSVTVPIGVLTGTAGKTYTMTVTGDF